MNDKKKPSYRARITSLVPGRIRIKLHPKSRDPQIMHEIKTGLEAQEGIHDVRVTQANGSVTLKYVHRHHSTAGILRLIEDLDVVVESIGHLPSVETQEREAGNHAEALGFLGAVEDLNRRIHNATGIPIDLKLVLPLAFAGAGIWSIGKKGLMIETAPGWLFLWLAFDMFVKLHPI